jgi:hypothetical protein
MRYQYNSGSVERWQHIRRGERVLLAVWKPCPVFDAFSAALADDLAAWRRVRAVETARPPASLSRDDD